MSTTKLSNPLPESQPVLKTAKPTLESLYAQLDATIDPQEIHDIIASIFSHLKNICGVEFQSSLQGLLIIFRRGYSSELAADQQLCSKMLGYFVELSRLFKKQGNSAVHYRMFFVLSLLAQFCRQQPKYKLPFNRHFLLNLFETDSQQLQGQERAKLLAILGVLFSNLAQQGQSLQQLKLAKQFKQTLLENYSLIEELYTLKLFNQCIVQLQTKRLTVFTLCELERYGIVQTIRKTVPGRQGELVASYLHQLFPRSQ